MSQVYVIMGVSGSGKTTVGELLATELECPFYDADDFHPPENIVKMAGGIPLNDNDRAPWLARLAEVIQGHLDRGDSAVLACSALKKRYREQLRVSDQVEFIFLDGDFDLIWQRMSARKDHYMKADMLRSQFAALEPPDEDEALTIPIDQSVDAIQALILQTISQ
ncbi:MAG: gluconokinase [Candidatus Promineifilaceae bacterium]|nr:gluconokinase [Candidatus Promineifilaceae bacterium]